MTVICRTYNFYTPQKQKGPIDLFLDSDSFYNCIPQTNYCNNNLLILNVKQLNEIVKLYYFCTLKALWYGHGKIKMYYGNVQG